MDMVQSPPSLCNLESWLIRIYICQLSHNVDINIQVEYVDGGQVWFLGPGSPVVLCTNSPLALHAATIPYINSPRRSAWHGSTKAPPTPKRPPLVLPSVHLESLCAGTQNVQRLSLNCEKCYLLALSHIFWTNCNLPATPQVLTLFQKFNPRHNRCKQILILLFSDDLISDII